MYSACTGASIPSCIYAEHRALLPAVLPNCVTMLMKVVGFGCVCFQ